MLPRGTARGGHSLGALYAEATGGGGFDNAHDAMADARALTTVWRWISAVEAMGSAAAGAADEQARTRCFQAELQRLGYATASPPKARAARGGAARGGAAGGGAARGGAAAAAAPSKAAKGRAKAKAAGQRAAAAPPLSGAASLLEVPGVSSLPSPCHSPLPSSR